MSDDTRRGIGGARGEQAREGQLAELGLPLEELVRRGARDILQRAIEAGSPSNCSRSLRRCR